MATTVVTAAVGLAWLALVALLVFSANILHLDRATHETLLFTISENDRRLASLRSDYGLTSSCRLLLASRRH